MRRGFSTPFDWGILDPTQNPTPSIMGRGPLPRALRGEGIANLPLSRPLPVNVAFPATGALYICELATSRNPEACLLHWPGEVKAWCRGGSADAMLGRRLEQLGRNGAHALCP